MSKIKIAHFLQIFGVLILALSLSAIYLPLGGLVLAAAGLGFGFLMEKEELNAR